MRYISKSILTFALAFFVTQVSNAQEPLTYKVKTNLKFGLSNEFDPNNYKNLPTGVYFIQKAKPEPAGYKKTYKEEKAHVNAERRQEGVKYSDKVQRRSNVPEPVVMEGFSGAIAPGIPNDNNLAVSRSGWVVSVLNSHIRIFDNTGKWYKNWTLEAFPQMPEQTIPDTLGLLDRSYDPKIVYDDVLDKFIIVFLQGSESTDTRIIVAFSKTDNPLDGWFVYQLTGNPFEGQTWSDYPIVSLSKQDLYITVNIVKDNTPWQDGFTQSVIWQIPKKYGFDGDTLRANLIGGIQYENRYIWNVCGIPGGLEQFDYGMYFLSVRPSDYQNDTVFIHRISNNFSDGEPKYSVKYLVADKKYGLPPDGYQPSAGYRLQTNDARVLSGFIHAGKIQYVQTTRNFENNRSAIYHGIINDIFNEPKITSEIITDDSLDLAYPSMVYAGDGNWNDNAMITFSHTSENHSPGTSVVYMNDDYEYTSVVKIKEGEGLINTFLPDSIERWGDYTGIQRDYSQPGAFWTAGSFGTRTNSNGTWINKVLLNDKNVSVSKISSKKSDVLTYPNPAKDILQVEFIILNQGEFSLIVYDMSGKAVHKEIKNAQKTGKYRFYMDISHLPAGIYYYQIKQFGSEQTITEKFIIE